MNKVAHPWPTKVFLQSATKPAIVHNSLCLNLPYPTLSENLSPQCIDLIIMTKSADYKSS